MYNKKELFLYYQNFIKENKENIIFFTLSNLNAIEADEIRKELVLFEKSKLIIIKRKTLEKVLNINLHHLTKMNLKLGILYSENLSLIINNLKSNEKIKFHNIESLQDPNKFKVYANTKKDYIGNLTNLFKRKIFGIIQIIQYRINNI